MPFLAVGSTAKSSVGDRCLLTPRQAAGSPGQFRLALELANEVSDAGLSKQNSWVVVDSGA